MGVYASIDIDLQELLATVATVQAEYDIFNGESEDGLDGRAILLHRLTELGWITPTHRAGMRQAFDKADGKALLQLLGGVTA